MLINLYLRYNTKRKDPWELYICCFNKIEQQEKTLYVPIIQEGILVYNYQ